MIHFSFSSVLMTILVSNLLLIVISLLFRDEDVLAKIGFRLTAMFCIITLIRFLFPYELPFTKTVILPPVLSNILFVLRHRHNIFRDFGYPSGIFSVLYGWWKASGACSSYSTGSGK